MHDRGGPAFLRPDECRRDGSQDQGPEIVATRHRDDRDGQDHATAVRAWARSRPRVDKAAAIAKEIGFKLESAARVGGGSDGNFTVAMGIPTLDGLGVDGDGAHTNHEYMLFSSIEPRTRLLQGLMEQLE